MTDFQTPPPLLLFLTSNSVRCRLKKRSLHYCVLQDSQETILEEKERGNSVPSLFHCYHLQTLNASSNGVAKDGVKRTEHVPIGKASLDFTGTRIWPTPRSIPSLGLAPHSRLCSLCWGRQRLQITQPSRVSTTVILLLASVWILRLAQLIEAPVLGSHERKAAHNRSLVSPSTPTFSSLSALSLTSQLTHGVCSWSLMRAWVIRVDTRIWLLTSSEFSPVWEL